MSRTFATLVALSASFSLFWGTQLQAQEGASFAVSPANAEIAEQAGDATPPRIYADSFLVWIYARPERDPAPIGYLRGGQSVGLRSHGNVPAGERVRRGCGRGWFAVQPAGFICLDHAASLTPTRYSESMAALAPRRGPYPFDYALSMGTPSYRRVPEAIEWERREREFGEAKAKPLPAHWQGHEELVSDETLPLGPLPSFLRAKGSVAREPEKRLERRDVPFGSMLSITGSFEQNGRQFLQSADGTVVPSDRMRVFKRSTFQGVDISPNSTAGLQLPLAWSRQATHHYSLAQGLDCQPVGSGNESRRPINGPIKLGRLETRSLKIGKNCLVRSD